MPGGKEALSKWRNVILNDKTAIKFRSCKTHCRVCEVREKCLRHPETSEVRQVCLYSGAGGGRIGNFHRKDETKDRLDKGQTHLNRRLGTAEPPFAHIKSILGLDRFSLRGKRKVNTQWLLYCITHNLLKVHRYGEGFA